MSRQGSDRGSRRKDVGPGPTSALEQSDPNQLGPFRLVSRLGAGGMGMVYLGRSPTGQLAAVKVLRHEIAGDEEFRQRFEREFAAASKVSGPFSARVLQASESDDPQLWIATEYVPGPSLNEAVRSFGPLPQPTLTPLWLGLLGALQTIHAAGVVHRDLKPSNVLLAQDGPRVIDFGVSTFGDATSLTRTGMVIGTPAYMSPEQVRDNKVGPASDVFALACTMAFAASGQNPFGGESAAQILFRVAYEEPELVGLPEQIASAVRRSLAKDPSSRPSVTELIGMVPAADEASRLLAHGKWLPEAIERRTAEHAGTVYAWDVQRPPSPRTELLSAPTHSELPAPPADSADPPPAEPGPGSTVVRDQGVHPRTAPSDATTSIGSPPDGGPPPTLHPQGGSDPEDEPSLRTHTLLVPADTPPLPRLRRRSWHQWVPIRRSNR
ncbi:hypothetical protein GCM10011579_097190 [Streptomyces albiflavescens]|uniref:Protein kinase domain-containing protein n=1 Tax=Streptomyces albiflavescens TaxID=1623582 RepID=A0A918DBH4_9ACTN|nr:serine/threonine-protein kinase [Streptomyces albiflavescens]GGN96114.1 hypothetical protein GCM10011579_097190 [Streptomyces albiflavescens]